MRRCLRSRGIASGLTHRLARMICEGVTSLDVNDHSVWRTETLHWQLGTRKPWNTTKDLRDLTYKNNWIWYLFSQNVPKTKNTTFPTKNPKRKTNQHTFQQINIVHHSRQRTQPITTLIPASLHGRMVAWPHGRITRIPKMRVVRITGTVTLATVS